MEKLLDQILEIASLTEKEKVKFKETFYKILVMKILIALQHEDKDLSNTLYNKLIQYESTPDELGKFIKELSKNSEVKQKIDETTGEVLTELAEAIAESATEEQKQQILTSLSA